MRIHRLPVVLVLHGESVAVSNIAGMQRAAEPVCPHLVAELSESAALFEVVISEVGGVVMVRHQVQAVVDPVSFAVNDLIEGDLVDLGS